MSGNQLFGAVAPIQTIKRVQHDLFPLLETLNIDSRRYISIILNHSRVTDEDKLFIRNGVQWLNEEAVQIYRKIYTQLSKQQRQNILKSISKERWGESWIDMQLSFIMEAMFSDKVYGVNKDNAGQKWLNFSNGAPYPKEPLL